MRMIPSSALASRLYCLAVEMRDVAALMAREGVSESDPEHSRLLISHAGELRGAADITDEWAGVIGADPSPTTSESA